MISIPFRCTITWLALAVLAGAAAPSAADAPVAIGYQGVLTLPDGTVVPDGTGASAYTIKFEIFDAAQGGTLLYQTTLTVNVVDGLYNVLLTSVPSHDLAAAFDGPSTYMQVTIVSGGGLSDVVLEPLQQIASVPYALQTGPDYFVDASDYPTIQEAIDQNASRAFIVIPPGVGHDDKQGYEIPGGNEKGESVTVFDTSFRQKFSTLRCPTPGVECADGTGGLQFGTPTGRPGVLWSSTFDDHSYGSVTYIPQFSIKPDFEPRLAKDDYNKGPWRSVISMKIGAPEAGVGPIPAGSKGTFSGVEINVTSKQTDNDNDDIEDGAIRAFAATLRPMASGKAIIFGGTIQMEGAPAANPAPGEEGSVGAADGILLSIKKDYPGESCKVKPNPLAIPEVEPGDTVPCETVLFRGASVGAEPITAGMKLQAGGGGMDTGIHLVGQTGGMNTGIHIDGRAGGLDTALNVQVGEGDIGTAVRIDARDNGASGEIEVGIDMEGTMMVGLIEQIDFFDLLPLASTNYVLRYRAAYPYRLVAVHAVQGFGNSEVQLINGVNGVADPVGWALYDPSSPLDCSQPETDLEIDNDTSKEWHPCEDGRTASHHTYFAEGDQLTLRFLTAETEATLPPSATRAAVRVSLTIERMRQL